MQVEVSRLEQVFSVDEKKMQTYLVLTFQSGIEIKAAISDSDAEDVVNIVMLGTAVAPKQASYEAPDNQGQTDEDYVEEEEMYEAADEQPAEEPVLWMELPENLLPIGAKRKLAESGAADLLTIGQIKEVLLAQPKLPMLQPVPRSVQVRTDEMGNPIVPQRVPTIEVEDEDGVAQL